MTQYSIFISHHSVDKKIAEGLKLLLGKTFNRLINVFISEDIQSGDDWFFKIKDALDQANEIITIFTKESVDRPWINIETGYGIMTNKITTPVLFGGIKIANLSHIYQRQTAIDADSIGDVTKLYNSILSRFNRVLQDFAPNCDSARFYRQWNTSVLASYKPPPLVDNPDTDTFKKIPTYPSDTLKGWKDLVLSIRYLAKHLKSTNIKFDYIASFSGGGLIIADLLHIVFMEDLPILTFIVERYDAIDKGGSKYIQVKLPFNDISILKNKSILLLDDVVESGNTIKAVKEYLLDKVLDIYIYTAVLGKHDFSAFEPHYFDFEFSSRCILPYGVVPRKLITKTGVK